MMLAPFLYITQHLTGDMVNIVTDTFTSQFLSSCQAVVLKLTIIKDVCTSWSTSICSDGRREMTLSMSQTY